MGDLFSVKNKNGGKSTTVIIVIIVLLLLIAIGSSEEKDTNIVENSGIVNEENVNTEDNNEGKNDATVNTEIINEQVETNINNEEEKIEKDKESKPKEEDKTENKIDLNKIKDEELAKIPVYKNSPYYVVNNNKPFFNDTDLVTASYEKYSELDNLRKMWSDNCMHRKRFNANRRKGKYRKCKTNGLADCKV